MANARKPRPVKKKKAETPDEDLGLWRAVAKTVEPLKKRDIPPEQFGAKPPIKGAAAAPLAVPVTPASKVRNSIVRPAPATTKPVPVPPALPDLSHTEQPGLDKATAKRMRRGKVNIAGRIDLHGMTQAEAHPVLDAFLESAWRAGKREVLVITGKGTRADGSIGVLREQVPRWLNSFPNRAKVVAFQYASPKDGGEGALYVRLKKR